MSHTERLLWFVVGLILGTVLAFLLMPLPWAEAQGVGFFGTSSTGTRTNCSQITDPVQGQTVCFEQSENTWKRWTGTAWAPLPVAVVAGGLPTGEQFLLYGGDGVNGPFIVASSSTVLIGNQITSGITAPGLGLNNNRYVYGLNLAGTAPIPMLGVNTGNQIALDPNGLGVNFGATANLANDASLTGSNVNGTARIQIARVATSNLVVFDGIGAGASFGGSVTLASALTVNGASTFTGSASIGGAVATQNGVGTLTVATALYLNATQTLWVGGSPSGAPVCTNNCGTAPVVTGTNSAMRVTMGLTGTPRSPFLVLFNGTWNAKPACIAQLDTATTTTVSVTNATTTGITVNTVIGPSQGGVFSIHCLGVN